jgi:hypothetical protein
MPAQQHAEIRGPSGTYYTAWSNPDGSITYGKRSRAGVWYEVRPDSRDPWLRELPKSAKTKLDKQLATGLAERGRENPTSGVAKPSDVELIVGGLAGIVLTGMGVYLVYSALNPPGTAPDTSTTLEDTSSLAALAVVAV